MDHVALGAPDPDSPYRQRSDWFEDPWAADELKAQRKAERHRRWIVALTQKDWDRIGRMVDQVTESYSPAALPDLDAPIRVGAVLPEQASRLNGERFGMLKGRALLAWPKIR